MLILASYIEGTKSIIRTAWRNSQQDPEIALFNSMKAWWRLACSLVWFGCRNAATQRGHRNMLCYSACGEVEEFFNLRLGSNHLSAVPIAGYSDWAVVLTTEPVEALEIWENPDNASSLCSTLKHHSCRSYRYLAIFCFPRSLSWFEISLVEAHE